MFCVFLPVAVKAGVSWVDGTSPALWKVQSLVYAVVEDVSDPEHPYGGDHTMTIRPIATLTGKFDCGLYSKLEVIFNVGEVSFIKSIPKVGRKVVLLLEEDIRNVTKQSHYVPPSGVSFMPTECAIAEVTGIEDPAVIKIMAAVRKARTEKDK